MLSLYVRENDCTTGKLSFQGQRIRRISHISPKIIDITSSIDPGRVRVEAFIRRVFQKSYAADISVRYPYLISVSNEAGDILAAAGFRYAQCKPLFLEQYIDRPIEEELNIAYGLPVTRNAVAEIGSLASGGHGASVFLFAALASWLDFKQIRYTVCTGTHDLYRHLQVLGLQPHKVCQAEPSCLQDSVDDWGSYYTTQPYVLAGSVQQGVQSLQRTLGSVYETRVPFRYYRGQLS